MKRLINTESGQVHSLPLIIIFGSRPNGPQGSILAVFKAMGIGSGRNMYQPDCKAPDYTFLAARLPIIAGHTVDRDWDKLYNMFSDAKFILVMQDESNTHEGDKEYYEAVRERYGNKLLSIYITDANIPQTIMDFINLPNYLETLTIETLQSVNHITLAERVRRFLYARSKWVKAGKPERTLDEVRHLYDEYCAPCKKFDNDSCGICGCRIKRNTKMMNKLAWATESCPLPISKWEAAVKVPTEDLDIAKIEELVKKEIAEKVPAPPGRRCCGG